MKVLMSSRPRRGSCSEYCNSMSGAANSSTMPRLQVLPQKCVNHRPTMALLSSSLDMSCLSVCSHMSEGSTELPTWTLDKRHRGRHPLSVWDGRNDVTREIKARVLDGDTWGVSQHWAAARIGLGKFIL